MIASNRHFAVVLVIGILIGLVISQLSTFFVSLKQPQRPQVVTKYQDVMPLIDVFPNEMYRTKSTPLVLTGGSVSKGRKWLSIEGKECFSAFCPPDVPNQKVVQIEGDAIAVYISHHYFHFVYESMLQMYPLLLHGIFERYPNATILCFGEGVPNQLNFEMMKALKFDLPRDKMMMARTNTVYKIGAESTLIVTRHNNYHSKKEFLPYNFWLLDSMRLRLDTPRHHKPQDSLFLSRKGYRRGIEREDELFASLQLSIPSLQRILPDDFTVAQQAELFAQAKLIIAPHGASLVNVIFSNWNELVLIEFSPENNGFATFRMDLQVKRHYLMQCQSVPCKVADPKSKQCDVWQRQIDVNVTQVTQVVNSILSGGHPDREDFIIRRHADL
jgi:hypothetical protein